MLWLTSTKLVSLEYWEKLNLKFLGPFWGKCLQNASAYDWLCKFLRRWLLKTCFLNGPWKGAKKVLFALVSGLFKRSNSTASTSTWDEFYELNFVFRRSHLRFLKSLKISRKQQKVHFIITNSTWSKAWHEEDLCSWFNQINPSSTFTDHEFLNLI